MGLEYRGKEREEKGKRGGREWKGGRKGMGQHPSSILA